MSDDASAHLHLPAPGRGLWSLGDVLLQVRAAQLTLTLTLH
jgi:hypothetical protein